MKTGSRALQRRLRSVRSIAQLTRAMKTVAVSKHSRAQALWRGVRPYQEALARMADTVGIEDAGEAQGAEALYVVMTANRSLCGSYNSDLWAFLRAQLAAEKRPYRLLMLGHWGAQRAAEQLAEHVLDSLPLSDLPRSADAWALADRLEQEWATGRYAAIVLVAQGYVNILKQVPEAAQLFPRAGTAAHGAADGLLMLPGRAGLAQEIRRRDLRVRLYGQMLAAMTGAHGAMLMAMRSANDNAETMGRDIERRFNRLRQSAVTTQVLELARGAQSNQE